MRTVNDYMKLPYKMEIIEETEEGGYTVCFPDLEGCITCGDTLDQAVANANEAKKEWLLAAIEEGISIPEPEELERYSGQFKLRIPKSLHRQLAETAKREGTSMNQYCLYLLSKNNAVNCRQ